MSKQITFQPPELPLRVEVDHATKFRIVEPGGHTLLSGHCSLEQANVFAAAPLLLDTLKKVHTQLIDWGMRNGMAFQLIGTVQDAIAEADPRWKP